MGQFSRIVAIGLFVVLVTDGDLHAPHDQHVGNDEHGHDDVGGCGEEVHLFGLGLRHGKKVLLHFTEGVARQGVDSDEAARILERC